MGWLKKTAVAKKIKKTDISLSYGSEFERMVYERFMQYLNERKGVKNIIGDIKAPNDNMGNAAFIFDALVFKSQFSSVKIDVFIIDLSMCENISGFLSSINDF